MDDKSNEITAIPLLLQVLEVSGGIVTIDAIGCQTEIAETIIAGEADYVLSLKENQENLYKDVQLLFDDLEQSQYKAYRFDYDKTVNKEHGRMEIRECWAISDREVLRHLRGFENWKNLLTVSRIRSQRRIGTESSCEDRYHIASIVGAKRVLWVGRTHLNN
ncbi:MAG TPA: ISAs1 family transposase [Anaerolineales bacterium]